MDSETVKVFDVLGQEIRLNTGRGGGRTPPEDVVDCVRRAAGRVQERSPGLDRGQVLLLAALGIAEERMDLAREYEESIDVLQSSLTEALDYIDQAALPQ